VTRRVADGRGLSGRPGTVQPDARQADGIPVDLQRLGRGLERRFERFYGAPADARWLAAARIVYAALGLWFACKTLGYIDLVWGSVAAPARDTIVALHGVWIGLLGLLLLGVGDRLVALAHYVVVSSLLFQDDIGSTVNDELYLVTAFFAVFIGTNQVGSLDAFLSRRLARWPRPVWARAWPVYLLGVAFGVKITTAGITKVFDPFWWSGSGFYMTYSLPWIKPGWMAPLADLQWLMWTLNYAGMVMELLFLPLFLLPRTRALAVALLTAFFAQLVFPLRIDLIGPFGLVLCMAFASLLGQTPAAPAADPQPQDAPPSWRPRLGFVLCGVLTVHIALFSALAFADIRWFRQTSLPPVALGADLPDPSGDPSLAEHLSSGLNRASRAIRARLGPLNRINRETTQIQRARLFTQVHFFGVYAYRVLLVDEGGERLEPVEVFREDKSAGARSIAPGEPRYFQRLMYDLTRLARTLQRHDEPDPRGLQACHNLIHYALGTLDEEEEAGVRGARVVLSPIVMPLSYRGNVAPWRKAPWQPVCTWRPGKPLVLSAPDPYPYVLPSA